MFSDDGPEQRFWNCISILLRNFHAIDRKIFACKIIAVKKITKRLNDANVEYLESRSTDTILRDLNDVLSPTTIDEMLTYLEDNSKRKNDTEGLLVSSLLLSKKSEINTAVLGVIDFKKLLYVCKFPSSERYDDFSVELTSCDLKVKTLTQRLGHEETSRWCEFILKPKILRWWNTRLVHDVNLKVNIQSLRLVDVEEYNDFYKDLKRRHAAKISQMWQQAEESTDPLKFIYEDLAIASYLICLWNCTGTAPNAFADLGCGNGLLVYILAAEGYRGYGYDIRRRKLWSCYPDGVQLLEEAIEPKRFQLPDDVDWIIGNHADELSPWLPVMAATAPRETRYFLLPCCAYEFSGRKYQRRVAGRSVYRDFLDYVKRISDQCGYRTLEDRLKIPSTKRIALVGIERRRAHHQDGEVTAIWNLVRCELMARTINGTTEDIQLREKTEPVRNCTQIGNDVINDLVTSIFHMLLDAAVHDDIDETWNVGGRMSLHSIAEKLDKDKRQRIRNECGGIKTLLRNKHEIFEFHVDATVGVRKPSQSPAVANQRLTAKKRQCFFQQHHPNGCPLADDLCRFLHT